MEVWRKILGSTDGEVSNLGNVRRNGILVTPRYDPEGYPRCSVGGIGTKRIHQFVAQTFLENPGNLPYVDHINQDKTDNRVENLRWVGARENGKNASYSKPRREPVIGICIATQEIKEFPTQAAAHRYLGLREGSGEVNKVLKGKRRETHGWTFMYKSDYYKTED